MPLIHNGLQNLKGFQPNDGHQGTKRPYENHKDQQNKRGKRTSEKGKGKDNNKGKGKGGKKGGQRFTPYGGKSGTGGYQNKGDSKAKGKGTFIGECYNCGKSGHSAKFCTEVKKFNFECYNCGKKGHKAADCRAPKGAGKGGQKGKGYGVHEIAQYISQYLEKNPGAMGQEGEGSKVNFGGKIEAVRVNDG